MLNVRLPEATSKRLEHVANLTGRTKSSIVRQLIDDGLEDLEDYAEAVAALAEHHRKGGRTYSMEEVSDDALDREMDRESPERSAKAG